MALIEKLNQNILVDPMRLNNESNRTIQRQLINSNCKLAKIYPHLQCGLYCVKRIEPAPELRAKGMICAYQKHDGIIV